MTCFVDTSEGEVAILASLAVLDAINDQWCIPCCSKLRGMCVVHCKTDCLPSKPVANIVGITIEKRDSHRAVQNHLEVLDENGVDEVTGLLKSVIDLTVGQPRVVGIDSDGVLGRGQIQEILEILHQTISRVIQDDVGRTNKRWRGV